MFSCFSHGLEALFGVIGFTFEAISGLLDLIWDTLCPFEGHIDVYRCLEGSGSTFEYFFGDPKAVHLRATLVQKHPESQSGTEVPKFRCMFEIRMAKVAHPSSSA